MEVGGRYILGDEGVGGRTEIGYDKICPHV